MQSVSPSSRKLPLLFSPCFSRSAEPGLKIYSDCEDDRMPPQEEMFRGILIANRSCAHVLTLRLPILLRSISCHAFNWRATCTSASREQISWTRAGTSRNMSGLQASAEYGEAREGVREERRRRQKIARKTILGMWRSSARGAFYTFLLS